MILGSVVRVETNGRLFDIGGLDLLLDLLLLLVVLHIKFLHLGLERSQKIAY